MADKRWTGFDPELRQIPATNATRVGSPGTRKPRLNRAMSDCISYNVNDPDGTVKIFEASRKTRKQRIRTEVVETIHDRSYHRKLASSLPSIHEGA